MKLKFPSNDYIPYYVLISSLFWKSFILQYLIFAFLILYWFITRRGRLKNSIFILPIILLIPLVCISWIYNFHEGNADKYSILFWIFSYIPNFILVLLTITYSNKIRFDKIYGFYKKLTYLQTFLLIISAIRYKQYIVGDCATGTVGNANWVSFHIGIVILYETIRLITDWQLKVVSSKKFLKTLEIIYLIIVFLIPESTANLGFVVITIGLFITKEFIIKTLNPLKISLVIGLITLILFFISRTYVYTRIEEASEALIQSDYEKNPFLSKFNMYYKLLKGEILNGNNTIIGLGPSTFTSRSSVVRMPEERINSFPLSLPYFKSKHFNKHITSTTWGRRRLSYSYGNFATPKTSVISIFTELGCAGFIIFILFFYLILKRNRRVGNSIEKRYLKNFIFYFTVFFVMNLFHLNFWEYPIISFTYIIFTFTILFSKHSVN